MILSKKRLQHRFVMLSTHFSQVLSNLGALTHSFAQFNAFMMHPAIHWFFRFSQRLNIYSMMLLLCFGADLWFWCNQYYIEKKNTKWITEKKRRKRMTSEEFSAKTHVKSNVNCHPAVKWPSSSLKNHAQPLTASCQSHSITQNTHITTDVYI